MRTAHLFAGAGGGILADLILGHEPIVAVEWDAYACAVLRRQFPGLRVIEGDVRAVDFARELAGVDALCAGFPCTDISAANPNGKGIDGERSGLYREVMRAIDAVRPAWVFLENSPHIRTKGRHIVIGDLVARGYSWRDGILSASDVGAPHRRDRWWLLAHRDRDEPQAGLPVDGGRIEPGDSPAGNGCADVAHANGIIGGSRRASDADEGEGGRDADGGGQRKVYVADAGCRRLSGQNQWEMERTGGTEAVGTSEIVADAGGNGPQDAIQGGGAHEAEGDQVEAAARCDQRPGCWEAERGVGLLANGLAIGSHQPPTRQTECEEGGSEKGEPCGTEVQPMRQHGETEPPSPGLQQTAGSDYNLPGMPHAGPQGGVREDRQGCSGEAVGRKANRSNVSMLRGGVPVHQAETENMQPIMRQQDGVASSWWGSEPPIPRVVDAEAAGAHGNWTGRIKCLGNGQVPLAAAAAWRLLGGPS